MMNNAQLATASLNDIVFDGRNQGYGAYELRALYQRHVTRALVIAVAMCALLLVFPLIAQLLKDDTPVIVPSKNLGKHDLIRIEMPTDVLLPPPAEVKPPVQQPHQATTRSTQFVVAPDNKAIEDVLEQKELQNVNVAAVTSTGTTTQPTDLGLSGDPEGLIGGPEIIKAAAPYTYVEQMPQLPGGGGQAAIVAAIQRAVRYPAQAISNGVEGKIFASFTVNAQGEVIDVKIVKGLGSGLDEETMRAIKTLPKFIPGRQNGQDVSVSFTVPITYRIQ